MYSGQIVCADSYEWFNNTSIEVWNALVIDGNIGQGVDKNGV